ncbi:hypothetical protein [Candidatus Poriferisocius sp.]|uniref:hypothetical protein n=1 Tax=Candidatus Poriferisocius sp. TaxID=3101276 RepID=UPI003B51796D
MSVVFDLSEEAVKRLREEASRRRISVEELIGELADSLPEGDPLEAFIGCGESGQVEPFDICRERSELAASRHATTV